jgi:hypothetical protein
MPNTDAPGMTRRKLRANHGRLMRANPGVFRRGMEFGGRDYGEMMEMGVWSSVYGGEMTWPAQGLSNLIC